MNTSVLLVLLTLVFLVLLRYFVLWRRNASVRRRLRQAGFDISFFQSYMAIVRYFYFAADETNKRMAAGGDCRKAINMTGSTQTSPGEMTFTAKLIEYSSGPPASREIEIGGYPEGGQTSGLQIIRVVFGDERVRDKCSQVLRAWDVEPGQQLDIGYE